MNRLFRYALALWTVLFLVVSCVPLLTGNAVAGGAGIVVGAILLAPWLAGVIVLSILIWLTRARR